MEILPKLVYSYNTNPIKIQAVLPTENGNLIHNIENEATKIGKIIFKKKKKIGRFILLHLKSFFKKNKSTVIKTLLLA